MAQCTDQCDDDVMVRLNAQDLSEIDTTDGLLGKQGRYFFLLMISAVVAEETFQTMYLTDTMLQ